MKVHFEFTIDDLIDVGERLLSESRVIRGVRRGGLLASAFLGGVLGYALTPGVGASRLAFGLVTAVVCVAIYPVLRKATVKRRLRAYWRELLSGPGPFVCEVELTEQGVVARQFGAENSVPWPAVKAIEETADAVEIRQKTPGLIVVRDRAFSSPEEKRRFVELGRRLLLSHGGG